jgi:hypothetical protein
MTQVNRPTNDPKNFMLRIRVSDEYLEIIDAWIAKQPGEKKPSRSEAIRKLSLMAASKPKSK